MFWINFLHIYQPPGQNKRLLERVVRESYLKILEILENNSGLKITLNISGSLIEQLVKVQRLDILERIKRLINEDRIELAGTAMYHPLLPLLPSQEVKRQIELNEKISKKYLSNSFKKLKGFFLPEMAYNERIEEVIRQMGYQWIILDEIAFNGKLGEGDWFHFYEIKEAPGLKVFFKNRRISNLIVNAISRSVSSLKKEIGPLYKENIYLLTAMDGETFGHHRPGLEKTWGKLLLNPQIKTLTISQYLKLRKERKEIAPFYCSWSSSTRELNKNLPYRLWQDPKNKIHSLQWQLTNLVIKEIESSSSNRGFKEAREKLDQALFSCQYWWATEDQFDPLMIKRGEDYLIESLKVLGDKKIIKKAELISSQIIKLAKKKKKEMSRGWRERRFTLLNSDSATPASRDLTGRRRTKFKKG